MINIYYGKILSLFALMFVLGLTLFSPYVLSGSTIDTRWYLSGGEDDYDYVLKVLKEHRTGLGILEEERLASVIIEESYRYGLDPLFVMALIKTESTFFNWSRSTKGAVGLMQVLPRTGEYLASELRIGWEGEKTLYDPFLNVKMGIHYFSMLKEKYGEDTLRALAAYNGGPSYLSNRIRLGKGIPKRYGSKVFANYENLRERKKL